MNIEKTRNSHDRVFLRPNKSIKTTVIMTPGYIMREKIREKLNKNCKLLTRKFSNSCYKQVNIIFLFQIARFNLN